MWVWTTRIAATLAALVLVAGLAWEFWPNGKNPDTYILTADTILTMDAEAPKADALGVQNGRIVALGALSDVQSSLPKAKIIAAPAPVLIPGFIEPHTHPIATALLGAVVDVSGFSHNSRAEIMQTLVDAADAPALTPWFVAYGWDPAAIDDLTAPTLAEMDALAPDRPMLILTQMLHEAFVNTAALKVAGIQMDGPANVTHGIIRDENGHPTGTLRELEALNSVMDHLPAPANAAVELLTRRQYAAYAEAGYTTIGITGAVGRHPDPIGLLKTIAKDTPPLRSYVYLLPEQSAEHPLSRDANITVVGSKFWLDGSPFTGGAATEAPYEDSPLAQDRLGLEHKHHPHLTVDAKTFAAQVQILQADGHQIAVHAQGEQAIDAALSGFEIAQTILGPADPPHRLDHNALLTQEQMIRARFLGLSVGFFIDHIYYYADALEALFGAERVSRYMPVKYAVDSGLIITLHGDHPATPLDPLRSLKTATTRLDKHGNTIGGTQAISRETALKAMTVNAAQQLTATNIGALKVGYLADFTFLSGNPLADDLANISVLGTWKDGQPVATGPRSWARIPLIAKTLWATISG